MANYPPFILNVYLLTKDVLISVVVPCYKQAIYLDEALQSVWGQTYSHWECIVVDDGSPDDTESVTYNWCQKDPRFIYLKKTNGGLSSARNAGINLAKGTYVLPLDADDKISDNYLEECLLQLMQNDSTKVVYGKAVFFGEKEGVWSLPEYNYQLLLTRNLIYCTGMYRKADWVAAGGYDEGMRDGLEDWDFWLRLLAEKDNVTCVEEITFYYRIKERSMISSLINDKERQNKTYEYLYKKHYDKMNAVIGSPIQLYIDHQALSIHHANRERYIAELERLLSRPIRLALGHIYNALKKFFNPFRN